MRWLLSLFFLFSATQLASTQTPHLYLLENNPNLPTKQPIRICAIDFLLDMKRSNRPTSKIPLDCINVAVMSNYDEIEQAFKESKRKQQHDYSSMESFIERLSLQFPLAQFRDQLVTILNQVIENKQISRHNLRIYYKDGQKMHRIKEVDLAKKMHLYKKKYHKLYYQLY